VGHVLAWVVILGVAGVLVVAVIVPRAFGATPYAVLTSSMRPSLPEGTLAVVRPVSSASIGIGSVITYQLRSGEPAVVTHRVVALRVDGAGSRTFRTRGDANDVPDEGWVRPVQLKGELWYAAPLLGRVNAALSGREHRLLVYVVAAALLAYAAAMFTGSLRDRHRAALQREGGHP
jgi:signal peptidase